MNALMEQGGGSVKMICESVGMSRSTYYYRSQRGEESQLETDLETVAGQYPKYGTRRISQQLRRAPYHYRINRKRVQRLMRQKKLLRPVKRARYRTTDSQHPYPRYPNLMMDLEITQPEQVWVCDVTYVRLGKGFVFLAIDDILSKDYIFTCVGNKNVRHFWLMFALGIPNHPRMVSRFGNEPEA